LIFGFKRCGHEATEKRKAKTINCHYPDISWNSRCLLLWSSHTNFPLFSTDFQLSTRMLIFRKQNPEAEKFFLAFPSLNTSIFTTYLKIASTLTPFEGPDSKVTLPKFRSFNFLEQKESQRPKRKSFQTLSIMANWNLLPKSHREKDNLIINSFKPFKDTISKTNTCFRQRHDNVFLRKTFQRKDSVIVI